MWGLLLPGRRRTLFAPGRPAKRASSERKAAEITLGMMTAEYAAF